MQLISWVNGFRSLDSPPLSVVLPLAQYAVLYFTVVALYEKRSDYATAWDAAHRFWSLRDSWAGMLSAIGSTLGRLSRGCWRASRRVSNGRNGERHMRSGGIGRSGWSPG